MHVDICTFASIVQLTIFERKKLRSFTKGELVRLGKSQWVRLRVKIVNDISIGKSAFLLIFIGLLALFIVLMLLLLLVVLADARCSPPRTDAAPPRCPDDAPPR